MPAVRVMSKSLSTIAADLQEYIDSRQSFLTVPPAGGGPAMPLTKDQHIGIARQMFGERLNAALAAPMPAPDAGPVRFDLVAVLEAFYTGLAHLGVAFGGQWRGPDAPHILRGVDHARSNDDQSDDDESSETGPGHS